MTELTIYRTTNTGFALSNDKFKKEDLIIMKFCDIFTDMREGDSHEIYL